MAPQVVVCGQCGDPAVQGGLCEDCRFWCDGNVSPAGAALSVVLTCGSHACGHTFVPDPVVFAAGELACPDCAGWTFHAGLRPGVDPITGQRRDWAGGAS